VLGFTKQAFYQWKADPVSRRDRYDAHLINAAIDIHHDDLEFGYRFIADELPARGITASRNLWMSVLVDLKNRGVREVFFLVCDGLKGLPEVVANVWPQTVSSKRASSISSGTLSGWSAGRTGMR
jgi:hypothetical protein